MEKTITAPELTCNCCGISGYPNRYPDHMDTTVLMRSAGCCYSCAWWTLESSKPRRLVVKRNLLWVGSAARPTINMLGNRRFLFEWLDNGERFETRNLWPGGVIPALFDHLFPDTAFLIECDPM